MTLVAAFATLAFAATANSGVTELNSVLFNIKGAPADTTYTGPDPGTTNIPYLAWAGEQVKIEKCYRLSDYGLSPTTPFNIQFIVEDWSGQFPDAGKPSVEDGTVSQEWGSGDQSGKLCFKADLSSEKPGLAIVKLVITKAPLDLIVPAKNGSDPSTNTVVLPKHQFLIGWMTLNNPVCTELKSGSYGNVSGSNAGATLANGGAGTYEQTGDAAGGSPADLNAGGLPGRINCHVTGNLPMYNNLAMHNNKFVLPDDYKALADAFALDNDSGAVDHGPGGGAAIRWDIHGTPVYPDVAAHGGDAPWNPGFTPDCQPRSLDDSIEGNPPSDADNGNTNPSNDSPGYEPGPYSPGAPVASGPFGSSGFNSDSDVVDNCNVPTLTQFSSIYGFSRDSLGPYEPLQPRYTQYSDGQINEYDAQMPNAKLNLFSDGQFGYFGTEITESNANGGDISCVPTPVSTSNPTGNTGDGTQTLCGDGTTVPSFEGDPVLKSMVDSRDGGASVLDQGGQPANLFNNFNNPYYSAFIPGTARQCSTGNTASGIDAPIDPQSCEAIGGNNFEGVGAGDDNDTNDIAEEASKYIYWEGWTIEEGPGGFNGCRSGPGEDLANAGEPIEPSGPQFSLPSGATHILVYTDEHGDAQAFFYPGTEFVPSVKPTEPPNSGCELTGTIATTHIQAEAKYPDQPVFNVGRPVSNILTKNLISKRKKSLECHVKDNAGAAADVACSATAIGITGAPIKDETVCFSVVGAVTTGGAEPVGTSNTDNSTDGCFPSETSLDTGTGADAGIAHLFVFNVAVGQTAVAVVRFPAEGLKRSCSVTVAAGAAAGTALCSDSRSATTGTSTSNSNSTSSIVGYNGVKLVLVNKPGNKASKTGALRVAAVSIVSTRHGRYLVVKVNGSAKTAQIRIVMLKGTHVYKTALRKVKTNKFVRIQGLRIPKGVSTVRVSLVA